MAPGGVIAHSSSWTASASEPQNGQMHPRCERVTRRATTQGPISLKKGTTGTPGWQPKETAFHNYQSRASAQSTPLLRDAQKPWGGHPLCGRPADYLPPGTVGQWPPAIVQWWTEKGRRPENRPSDTGG